MKIVLDTNVWISATLWERSSAQKLLYKLLRDNHKIFISKEIIEEYIRVLKKEFFIQEYDAYVDIMRKSSTLVHTENKIRICEDPDDNKIIECAIASDSDFLITYDRHLLKIINHNKIKILTPEKYMKEIA